MIVVVALVVLGVGGFAFWRTASGTDSAPTLSAGSTAADGAAVAGGAATSCSLVTTEDVDTVLGGEDWNVLDSAVFAGGSGMLRAYDGRVLADVPTSCLATTADNGKLMRIARYQGGDAAALFAKEKQKATRGGDNGPYLGKDVQAGDEAFCTIGSKTGTAGSSAGALVRTGDTLIYASTTAAGEDDGANCDLSLRLVDKVHPS